MIGGSSRSRTAGVAALFCLACGSGSGERLSSETETAGTMGDDPAIEDESPPPLWSDSDRPLPRKDDPDAPTPLNCEDVADHSTDECTLLRSCDNDSLSAFCERDGENWLCQCESNSQLGSYQVTEATAEAACQIAMQQCVPGSTSSFSKPKCEDGFHSATAERCQAAVDCTRAATVDAASSVRRVDRTYAECQRMGSGIDCWCDTGVTMSTYRLELTPAHADAEGFAEACADVLEVCDQPADNPAFADVLSCPATQQLVTELSCAHNAACSREAEVRPGVWLVERDDVSVACQVTSVGTLGCQCEGSVPLGFELETQVATADACGAAMAVCRDPVLDELDTGVADCRSVSVSSFYESHCVNELVCTREARAAGTAIRVSGYMSAECNNTGAGSWQCHCPGGAPRDPGQAGTFDEFGETGLEVCDFAGRRCIEHFDVETTGLRPPQACARPELTR